MAQPALSVACRNTHVRALLLLLPLLLVLSPSAKAQCITSVY
jgi:hypothetical protein